jgi:hypothetical protein
MRPTPVAGCQRSPQCLRFEGAFCTVKKMYNK